VLIAGPNLTIDRTLTLRELRPGEVLRFERVVVTPGGKGLNVARAARALRHPAVLVSFVPGHTGRAGASLIAEEGVELAAVGCAGELRSTAIVLEHGGRTTVFNEPGPPVDRGDWERFEAELRSRLAGHRVLVCSGSVPPGSPADAYGRLTALARGAGLAAVVDASGETLAGALRAGADVVVPNLGEAEEALGLGHGGEAVEAMADARPRALSAAAALVERGSRAAVVTAAAAGAAVACADGAPEWLPAPRVAVVRNPIGAGDVLTAALAGALERGAPLTAAARVGVATAAASVESPTAGELDPERARALGAGEPGRTDGRSA
jgi:1-phosphofructokinase family hexose kinase